MKNDKKPLRQIPLSVLRDRLQDFEHYEKPDKAFHILLARFAEIKHHTLQWVYDIEKKGSMSEYLAKEFAIYCLQNDYQIMLED